MKNNNNNKNRRNNNNEYRCLGANNQNNTSARLAKLVRRL